MKNSQFGAFACASSDIYQSGLTKREYFAGLAIVSCSMVGMSDSEIKEYAKNAVKIADELLKQLENETTK